VVCKGFEKQQRFVFTCFDRVTVGAVKITKAYALEMLKYAIEISAAIWYNIYEAINAKAGGYTTEI